MAWSVGTAELFRPSPFLTALIAISATLGDIRPDIDEAGLSVAASPRYGPHRPLNVGWHGEGSGYG